MAGFGLERRYCNTSAADRFGTMMTRKALTAALLLTTSLALGGCGSTRFGGLGGGPVSTARAAPVVEEPIASSVPAGSVISEPLAPIGGLGAPLDGGPPPGAPSAPLVETRPSPPQQVASIAPTRTGTVGSWTARDATGASCRVQLSSAPALDLYKASSAGCANRDLAKVTAWDFRDGDVYLYQPGGTVAARLRSGGGSLEGVLTKSGAPLTLAR